MASKIKEGQLTSVEVCEKYIERNLDDRSNMASGYRPFLNYDSEKYLQINPYGIPEPDKNKIVYPDVLLVPMVAFDNNRFRLGYGGGYYDRYISRMKGKKNFISIGLAFDFQKVKRLPINKFDKKVDLIVTNKKIYK